MSRWEFMRQLEELLSDMSPSEREEALQYYNDYFNDAGRENEHEVIESLGSPEQVAKTVKEGLGESAAAGVFTENGFSSNTKSVENEVVKSTGNGSGQENKQADNNSGKQTETKKDDLPGWAIALIIICCVVFSPVLLGAATSVIGVIISIIATAFGLFVGFGVTFIVLYIVAIALLVAGFYTLFAEPLVGMALIAGGLICAGLGVLFMLLTVLIVGKLIPAVFQGIGYIFDKIFHKKGDTK